MRPSMNLNMDLPVTVAMLAMKYTAFYCLNRGILGLNLT
jgi:hypothetical protein